MGFRPTLVALVALGAGCHTIEPDPPPPASSGKIAVAAPGAVGAYPARGVAAPDAASSPEELEEELDEYGDPVPADPLDPLGKPEPADPNPGEVPL